jgi:S1-C subfamily serine protease
MRRLALYSSSRRPPTGDAPPETTAQAAVPPQAADAAAPARKRRLLAFSASSPWLLWSAIVVLAGALATSVLTRPLPHKLTQKEFNAAVLKTMETQVMPSQYQRAYEHIRPSVVRVVSYVRKSRLRDDDVKPVGKHGARPKPLGPATTDLSGPDDEIENGVGTGVVIVDKGVILTNLHVVNGADQIKVTFFDGSESKATITGVQSENDLAVLQAATVPDDLIPATMRSTSDLSPGDEVLAVGFPFGIGPSASGGIVSGLGRVFRSPEGKQEMNNLIQFDAAANPGNSGGPLVTMDGSVVGIVTAILNPTSARTFIGIGFAVPIENAASAAGLPPF